MKPFMVGTVVAASIVVVALGYASRVLPDGKAGVTYAGGPPAHPARLHRAKPTAGTKLHAPPPTVTEPTGFHKLPPPTVPLPTRPYTAAEAHPVPRASISQSALDQAVGTGSAFRIRNAWVMPSGVTIAAGANPITELPGLVVIPITGRPHFIPIATNGGLGAARIAAVKGHWVLVAQGQGYEVYNYATGATARSDPAADVL